MRNYILTVIILLCACQTKESQNKKAVDHQLLNEIVGTWQTGLIDGEWGGSRITSTYHDDGNFEVLVDFTDAGEMGVKGTYTIQGNILRRTIEGDEQDITYRIEGNTLYQKLGDENYVSKKLTPKAQ